MTRSLSQILFAPSTGSHQEGRALVDKIAFGTSGESAQDLLNELSSGLELPEGDDTSKEAVADDTVHETEEDARKRRLAEFLKRREHTGLSTGSATPTPPRDTQ